MAYPKFMSQAAENVQPHCAYGRLMHQTATVGRLNLQTTQVFGSRAFVNIKVCRCTYISTTFVSKLGCNLSNNVYRLNCVLMFVQNQVYTSYILGNNVIPDCVCIFFP